MKDMKALQMRMSNYCTASFLASHGKVRAASGAGRQCEVEEVLMVGASEEVEHMNHAILSLIFFIYDSMMIVMIFERGSKAAEAYDTGAGAIGVVVVVG